MSSMAGPPASSTNDNHSNVLGLAVGLGVGIPVALTVVVIAWVTYRHRRMSLEEDERHKAIDLDADIYLGDNVNFGDTGRYPRRRLHDFDAPAQPEKQHDSQQHYGPHQYGQHPYDQQSLSQQSQQSFGQQPYGRRRHGDLDDSSIDVYTPYLNSENERPSIDDFSRSFHSLVGPSPAYSQPAKIRSNRSTSSLSSQWQQQPAPPLPYGGSRKPPSMMTTDEEWSPRKIRRDSVDNLSRRTSVSYTPGSPEERPLSGDFDRGLVLPRQRSSQKFTIDEADEDAQSQSHRQEDEALEDTQDEPETEDDEPVQHMTAAEPRSPEDDATESESDVMRRTSRGHSAVLDLYDVYRKPTVRHANNASIGSTYEEYDEEPSHTEDDDVTPQKYDESYDTSTDHHRSFVANDEMNHQAHDQDDEEVPESEYEDVQEEQTEQEPREEEAKQQTSAHILPQVPTNERTTPVSDDRSTFSHSPSAVNSSEFSQATDYSREQDSGEDFSFDRDSQYQEGNVGKPLTYTPAPVASDPYLKEDHEHMYAEQPMQHQQQPANYNQYPPYQHSYQASSPYSGSPHGSSAGSPALSQQGFHAGYQYQGQYGYGSSQPTSMSGSQVSVASQARNKERSRPVLMDDSLFIEGSRKYGNKKKPLGPSVMF